MAVKSLALALTLVALPWGCNRVLGIDDDVRQAGPGAGAAGAAGAAPAGGAGSAGGDAGAAGGGAGAAAGSGQAGAAPVAPCRADETPGEGVFVDARAGDDGNDGSTLRPFRTLTRAAGEAVTKGLARVYLAPGSYPEALALRAGAEQTPGTVSAPAGTSLSFEGGWQLDGARWKRDCAPDARAKTALASPSTTGVSIRGAFGTLAFRTLSIATAAAAPAAAAGQPGVSCFGINAAGEGLRLRLENVEVDACPGGKGRAVAAAPPAAPAACIQSGAACSNGAPGPDAATPGLPARLGAFGTEGFAPGVGDPGATGATGEAGARGPGELGPLSCSYNDTDCCGFETHSPHGKCGCGGPGGPGGPGGLGGGASVALFVRGPGAEVDLAFATLRARAGGDGAPGGEGGEGGLGAQGAPFAAVAQCCVSCEAGCNLVGCGSLPAQPAGSPGGKGGKGSRGGGGTGGPSFALVSVGGVALARDQSVLSFGLPGASPQGAPAAEAGEQATVALTP